MTENKSWIEDAWDAMVHSYAPRPSPTYWRENSCTGHRTWAWSATLGAMTRHEGFDLHKLRANVYRVMFLADAKAAELKWKGQP